MDAIGKALDNTKSVAYTCAHPLPLLDTVLATIVLKIKDVPGDDNEHFYHSFCIVASKKIEQNAESSLQWILYSLLSSLTSNAPFFSQECKLY